MNYLAHCHIADITDTSVLGSLLGDFAKGSVQSLPYSAEVKFGIELHRAVDSFTDCHDFTTSLKSELGQWRRYGGIILDVFYDHQLASQFDQFSNHSLADFAVKCYRQLEYIPEQSPDRFKRVIHGMTTMNWLSGYQEIENIERALFGISKRLSGNVNLTESLHWYRDNERRFSQGFSHFYQDLQKYSNFYTEKHRSY